MSLAYIGIIVTFLAGLSKILGLNIGAPELTTTVEVIALFVGGILAFYGRFRKGDLKWFGGRKA